MRPIRTTFIAAFIALLLPFSVSASPLSGSDPVVSHGEVYRTIDGDTFVVSLVDDDAYARIKQEAEHDSDRLDYLNDRYKSIRVRLASVDTPESVHPDDSRNTRAGKNVSAIVKRLTEGNDAKVSCYDWGHYGRLICNMDVKSQGQWVDVSAWLIKNGVSPYVTKFGENPLRHSDYKALEASVE